MSRTLASRTVGRGLGKVEPPNSDTLIAYAAKAGSTSADGQGKNSPFTTALLKHLTTPGLDIRLALGRVHDEVMSSTGRKQEPFVYGALGGSTISLASLTSDPRDNKESSTTPQVDTDAPASRDYEAAAKVGTKGAWDAFLAKHPSGFYADLGREHRANLVVVLPSGKVEPKAEEEPKKGIKKAALPPSASGQKSSERGSRWECCMKFMSRPIPRGGVSPERRVEVCRSAASQWNYCKFLATP
jgi:hypothetical protein